MSTEAPSAAARACAIAVAAALSACASAAAKPQAAVRGAASRAVCIDVETLSDWQPVDDQQLLLWAPGDRRSHLLTLASPIVGMLFAEELDVVDGDLDGLICAHGEDEILVEDRPGGSASIAAIEYLSEKRTAELRGEPAMTA